jgi:hypothetical protein
VQPPKQILTNLKVNTMGRLLHYIHITDVGNQYFTAVISSERNYGVAANKNVALQVILEAYEELCKIKKSDTKSNSPIIIDSEMADFLLKKSNYHQIFEKWITIRDKHDITRLQITKSEFDSITASTSTFNDKRILGHSGDETSGYFVSLKNKNFVTLAERKIDYVKTLKKEDNWIKFSVKVLDKRIIAHLHEQISWQSALHDIED